MLYRSVVVRYHVVQRNQSFETTDTGLVYRAVCPFTPQLSRVHIVPTNGGMARLS